MTPQLKPIDYRTMTWKDIFDTLQENIRMMYNTILSTTGELMFEQFAGGSQSYVVENPVVDDMTWYVFRNDHYLGGKEGGQGYTVEGQIITFDEILEQDEVLTVMEVLYDGLNNLSAEYVSQIKEMFDQLKDLDIDITKQHENVQSVIDYLNECAQGVWAAKRICDSTKNYLDQLISEYHPGPGEYGDEIIAARRHYPLLGARLDDMVQKCENHADFINSLDYRDGDMVVVVDANKVHLYEVMDEYTGDLDHEEMLHGQTAVLLAASEDHTTIKGLNERVTALENRVNAITTASQEDIERLVELLKGLKI